MKSGGNQVEIAGFPGNQLEITGFPGNQVEIRWKSGNLLIGKSDYPN